LAGCGSDGGDDSIVVEGLPGRSTPPQGPAPVLPYEVVNTYPHDPAAYTQGLLFANGRLYESCGLKGQSNLREVDLVSGSVLRQVNNPTNQFAEGLALRGGRLFQATLDSGITNVWNQNSFVLESTVPTQVPAWGLAYIEQTDEFILSDGSSTLRFLAGSAMQEVDSLMVTDNGVEVSGLNELEYVNGVILANRYATSEILGIDANTGVVLFRSDLSGIIDKQAEGLSGEDVLNGIAYDAGSDRLFVTGKRWPYLYQIRILAQ
jgi:glutamine cyclotransferase